jgi:choice-of-anchor B domain-containing protein
MKSFSFIIVLFTVKLSFSQFNPSLNFDSLSHLNYVQLHNTYLNDVWGHVDELGNEYALVGARKGTSIVNVSNPSNPVEVYWEPGEESIWRDINTWQNFAYVTTEAESGLLILDLNSLPNTAGITSTYYTGPIGNEWQSAHSLYIDSAGYAYIFGANRGNGGVIILDIHTDPMNPIEVGVFDDWYCHDGYAQNDTMYLAHISDGFISIVDITDRSNPVLLGTKTTHNTFSHNIWTTEDGKYAFTTDEVSGAFVGSYDITDPTNIVELDLIQNSPGSGVIPHNVHYMDSFLVTSYYSDGVVVFDASRPHNLIKVGEFDTYPTQTPDFDGCWASYPFLPSGIILAADITEGLYISNPTYIHAAYLEGEVRNQFTNDLLSNVKITIEGNEHIEYSKNDGKFATGIVGSQLKNVTFSKVGFYPKTLPINFIESQVSNLNVYLEPILLFPVKIKVISSQTNAPIIGADVRLKSTLTAHETQTNGLGEADFSLFYQEEYEILIGKWTFKTKCLNQLIDETTGELIFTLDKGIEDDFTFDNGWTSFSSEALQGFWVRGEPNATSTNTAPGIDSEFDCGEYAFVTGNDPNLNPDFDEVKKGAVFLYSPVFDLSDGITPYLHYERWFYNDYGPLLIDDTLEIFVSNGITRTRIDYQAKEESTFFKWNKKSFYLPDYIELTSSMQIQIEVSDYDPNINITEAGFDNFFMDSMNHFNSIEEENLSNLKIFPNPVNTNLTILNTKPNEQWNLFDLQGKLVFNTFSTQNKLEIELSHINNGIYFLKSENFVFKLVKN